MDILTLLGLLIGFGAIIGGHDEVNPLGLQHFEELDKTWYRRLSAPQHAVHIDDQIPDIRWDFIAHKNAFLLPC